MSQTTDAGGREAAPAASRVARRPARLASPPMSQKVYGTLRRMLMAGGFRPGESVSLRTLAGRLDTSAMPVREAVNRLIAEQALQMLPNRQVIVPRMTRARFAELARLRVALECMVAAQAGEAVDDAAIEELEQLHAALTSAIARDDTPEILGRNRDFHFALYELARTEVTMPIIEALWVQVGPFLYVSLSQQSWTWTGTEHDAALAALRARDPEGTAGAIERDIRRTADLLMSNAVFDGDGPQP